MNNFLVFWKPEGLDYLRYIEWKPKYLASNQLARRDVRPNDLLWITTMRNRQWCLVAPMRVAEIVSPARMTELFPGIRLYGASHYAVARDADEPVRVREIPMQVAEQIRFCGKVDRLTLKTGIVNAQQLQTIRLLELSSANLLNNIWEDSRRFSVATN